MENTSNEKWVTVAKAFSIRNQLKKALAEMNINAILHEYTKSKDIQSPEEEISFDEEEFAKECIRIPIKDYDNRTYTEQMDRVEEIQDALAQLNENIETVSSQQRVLLVKKASLVNKLSFIQGILNRERSYVPKEEKMVNRVCQEDSNGNTKYALVKTIHYEFPRYSKRDELVKRERELKRKINSITDKITSLDHTEKVNVSFLSDEWA